MIRFSVIWNDEDGDENPSEVFPNQICTKDSKYLITQTGRSPSATCRQLES